MLGLYQNVHPEQGTWKYSFVFRLGLLTEALSSMFPGEAVHRGLSEAKQDSYSFFVCNDSGTKAETLILVYYASCPILWAREVSKKGTVSALSLKAPANPRFRKDALFCFLVSLT